MTRAFLVALVAAALVPRVARAQDTEVTIDREGAVQLSVVAGPTVMLTEGDRDNDQITDAKVDLRAEYVFYDNEEVAVGALLPISIGSAQEDVFDQNGDRAMLEITPSIRVHTMESEMLKPYGDIGIGVAHVFENDNDSTRQQDEALTGVVGRLAVGTEIELSEDGAASLVLEPVALNFYGMEDALSDADDNLDGFVRYTGMVGVAGNF